MAPRFEPGETLKKAFARVADLEMTTIRTALAEDDQETAIHRARRAIKRIRALLRLAKPALGGAFKKPNGRWRDAGRSLAGSRDGAVMLATYDKVADACADLPAKQVSSIRKKLTGGAGHGDGAPGRGGGAILDSIERAERSVAKLRWPRSDDDLFEGLLRTQQRLRQCRKSACADPRSEKLHEWRKRLKDDAAQAGLLRSVLARDLAVRWEQSKELAEILGEEHDLTVLHHRLAELTAPRGTKGTRDRLLRRIEEKREERCRAALERGDAMDSPRPKALAGEVIACWRSDHADAMGKGKRKGKTHGATPRS